MFSLNQLFLNLFIMDIFIRALLNPFIKPVVSKSFDYFYLLLTYMLRNKWPLIYNLNIYIYIHNINIYIYI